MKVVFLRTYLLQCFDILIVMLWRGLVVLLYLLMRYASYVQTILKIDSQVVGALEFEQMPI